MPKTAKRIVLVVATFILVVFAVFLFNQTMQIVQSARAVNVVFGNGVMWGLIFTYCLLLDDAGCALVPVAETDADRQKLLRVRLMTDFSSISRNGCHAILDSVDTL